MQTKIEWEEIRRQKTLEYGTEYRDWIWILVKQYKDRTHFLFELLQNAEDAGASTVRLVLAEDRLTLEHDGKLFSREDVISITKIKSSKNGSGSIGKFGIGFKSVYAYTLAPRIYSGDYAFEIRDFLFPYAIAPVSLQSGWTRIEIPFDRREDSTGREEAASESDLAEIRRGAFTEVARALHKQMDETVLLFLNHIKTLEIQIQGEPRRIRITKETGDVTQSAACVSADMLQAAIRISTDGGSERTKSYWIFTDNREKTAVALLHQGADCCVAGFAEKS